MDLVKLIGAYPSVEYDIIPGLIKGEHSALDCNIEDRNSQW